MPGNWFSDEGMHVSYAAASSTVLPGVGHMMMLEQPELFGAVVARILN